MRRYSKVSPRLYTGTVGKALRGDPAAQALAPYLIANPHANMIGLYHLPLAYAAADLGWPVEQVKAALEAIVDTGFARFDAETERVWVVDHARHEFGDGLKLKDNRIKSIARTLEDHRASPLFEEFLLVYGDAFRLASEGLHVDPSEGASEGVDNQEQEQEQEQEREQEQEQNGAAARWSPAHDYQADWNAIAEREGWPEVRSLTSTRKASLKVRETEPQWDWPALLAELERLEPGWIEGFAGWSFDWLIKNDTNYLKVLEGRYRRKRRRDPQREEQDSIADLREAHDWTVTEDESVPDGRRFTCACGYSSPSGDPLPHDCEPEPVTP